MLTLPQDSLGQRERLLLGLSPVHVLCYHDGGQSNNHHHHDYLHDDNHHNHDQYCRVRLPHGLSLIDD